MKTELKRNMKFLLGNVLVYHNINEIKLLTFSKNESIINEMDTIDAIYFVVSGKIKVYKEYENGKTLLLQFVDGLCSMGDLEYINEINIATGSVKAVSEVTLFKVDFKTLKNRYSTNNQFNDYMVKHLSKRFLSSTIKSNINLIYPLETRLASYILSMNIETMGNKVTLYNLQDLSDNLGTSYRHLHRTLKELVEKSIITRNRNLIEIIDYKKLEELSRGNIYEDSYNETEV